MKLTLLSFIFALSAQALTTPTPEQHCENCRRPSDFDLIGEIIGGDVTTEDCDPTRAALLQASMNETRVMSAYLADGIARRQRTDRANAQFWRDASDKMECVMEKMRKLTLICRDLPGTTEGRYTPLIGGRKIAIDLDYITTTSYGGTPLSTTTIKREFYIGSVILHELTHMCGTNDAEYFSLPTDSLLHNGRRSSASTADTYTNWALWGLCTPGPECTTRKAQYLPRKKK